MSDMDIVIGALRSAAQDQGRMGKLRAEEALVQAENIKARLRRIEEALERIAVSGYEGAFDPQYRRLQDIDRAALAAQPTEEKA